MRHPGWFLSTLFLCGQESLRPMVVLDNALPIPRAWVISAVSSSSSVRLTRNRNSIAASCLLCSIQYFAIDRRQSLRWFDLSELDSVIRVAMANPSSVLAIMGGGYWYFFWRRAHTAAKSGLTWMTTARVAG